MNSTSEKVFIQAMILKSCIYIVPQYMYMYVLGTITSGLLDITSIPNNYLSYQQHASSSSRTPAHENQCITTMTSINDLQNPSLPAHSTIGNQYPSTSNQNTHLRRMLATTSQTNCSQDVRIFQVPKQNQRQNSSINQGQAGSSGGLQSGWHSSSAFPPPHNMYPHHQGYTEVRNSIQVPNPGKGGKILPICKLKVLHVIFSVRFVNENNFTL